ncbi:MAG: DUF3225 domain-containing protein [Candidatus Rokubacteria bacterium]|nr:DUF3225 domain-containing protein [Candidatus Rokubacteria bacterium]
MKRFTAVVFLLLLVQMAQGAWAGPHEEVAQAARERAAAFREGNAEAVSAFYAEDAHYFFSGTPFRVEGREAIRAYFVRWFEDFPTRRVVARHSVTRVYGTTAVITGYRELTLVDRTGQAKTNFGWFSHTWVKLGEKWLVVQHDASLLPVPQ